ncbi:ribonuclease domain-containing protein [Fibrobacter sp.]|uniref:ribonuclease domain-containing protein n=1 Tax=Fibrobacter sp. TaxID=35828 RepID=UPI0025C3D6CE|nr:ribonuclease domain-containing protein [Fibrobacter sp.]MBR3073716.1 hypothetical protein [Fibrobacter sp.]
MKFIKVLFLATIACFGAVACTTSASEDNCKEQDSSTTITCKAYSYDECGNIICESPLSSSSLKVSSSSNEVSSSSEKSKTILEAVQESGKYTSKDSVAAYLCKFDKLPSNYVGKSEGQKLYESKTGKTFEKWNFNPWTTIGVMIGGDTYSNSEGLLPKGSYHEADVDYSAKNRGTKRLVYQSDCVIYYTADHYETFNRLEIQ